MSDLKLPIPSQQIGFASALREARELYLQDALLATMGRLNDVATVDQEIAEFVPRADAAALASRGLRAELLFAVPVILKANPKLLAYYRLLLGYSQKEFYSARGAKGASRFKRMEERGELGTLSEGDLNELAKALCESASVLLKEIGAHLVSQGFLDDLTLLTLGPQYRGGANNTRGEHGIKAVFGLIHQLVCNAAITHEKNCIVVRNASKRAVLIETASDPDITIREELSPGQYRNILAIEVKAGQDQSNIHNRIGESEKSHRKARDAGYTECWTIVNVSHFDQAKARLASGSTNRYYSLADISDSTSAEAKDFGDRILSMVGIRKTVAKRPRK